MSRKIIEVEYEVSKRLTETEDSKTRESVAGNYKTF